MFLCLDLSVSMGNAASGGACVIDSSTVTDTEFSCEVPDLTGGAKSVVVSSDEGLSSPTDTTFTYEFEISSISPNTGPNRNIVLYDNLYYHNY